MHPKDFQEQRKQYVSARLEKYKKELVKEWKSGQKKFLAGKDDKSHIYLYKSLRDSREDFIEFMHCALSLAKLYNVNIEAQYHTTWINNVGDCVSGWRRKYRTDQEEIGRLEVQWREDYDYSLRLDYKLYDDIEERLGLIPPPVRPELPTADQVDEMKAHYRSSPIKVYTD